MNACETVYPTARTGGCFFHLDQSVYHQIEVIGLQQRCNEPDDDTVRNYSHMLMALAYVLSAGCMTIHLMRWTNSSSTAIGVTYVVFQREVEGVQSGHDMNRIHGTSVTQLSPTLTERTA